MARAPGKIDSLTGIRFIAAFWVVLYHYGHVLPYPRGLNRVIAQGDAGVGLFFVLSGFILTYTYASRFRAGLTGQALRSFFVARFARIYPMYLLALVLGTPVALYVAGQTLGEPYGPLTTGTMLTSWLANLSLVQVHVPFKAVQQFWNAPGWSIATEAIFYLAFPFLFAALFPRLRTPRRLLLVAAVVYAVEVLAFGGGFILARMASTLTPLGDNPAIADDLFFDRLPFLRIWEFVLGMLAAMFYLALRDAPSSFPRWVAWLEPPGRRNLLLAGTLALTLLVLALPGGRSLDHLRNYVLFTPLFALLILLLAWGKTFSSAFLGSSVMVLLGEASYGLYLLHNMGIRFLLDSAWGRRGDYGLWVPVAFIVLTVLLSVLTLRFVETSARKLIRAWSARRAGERSQRSAA